MATSVEREARLTNQTSGRMSVSTIRLATFAYCLCPAFSGRHIVVSLKDVDIGHAKNYAVAISYIWGEFDREEHDVGHVAGDTNLHVYLELGKEWNINNMIYRLVEISQTGKWCWMDQVCIPQQEDEIRKTLAKISTIYRALPVIALLPGSLCRCLTTAYPDYQHAVRTPQVGYPTSSSADASISAASNAFLSSPLALAVQGLQCVNSNGSCSWTSRVWPSQEVRYAKSIKVIWADPEVSMCQILPSVSWNAPSEAVLPLSFSKKLGSNLGQDYHGAVRAIRHKNDQFFNDLGYTLVNAMEAQRINFTNRGFICFVADFLLGRELQIPQNALFSDSDVDGITRVIKAATTLANTRRQATEEKDYVFAVWHDWAGYQRPSNSNKMSVWELLEDAVHQARRIYSMPGTEAIFPSRCPSGMSNAVKSKTSHWCPRQSLHSHTIEDSGSVYGLLEWRKMHFINADGTIPVKLLDQHLSSSKSNTMTFEEWSRGQDAESLAVLFDACTQHWFGPDRTRFDVKWRMPLRDDNGIYRQSSANAWSAMRGNSTVPTVHDNMLRLMCDALNVGFDKCQQHGVDLMYARRRVTKQENQQVMTATEDILCVGLVNDAKLRSARMLGRRTLSVALWSMPAGIEGPYYEAAQVSSANASRFAVIGVWMPLDADLKILSSGAQAYIPFSPSEAGSPDLCLV